MNVYGSSHIHFIYKYKYIVVKLYLNLWFCSEIYIYICVGGVIILLPGTRIKKVVWIPVVTISHQYTITFVIIWNIQFWNYFVLSRAYVREPPCNNFDSTSSEWLFLVYPSSQWLFINFCGQDNIIRANVNVPWYHFTFQTSHPR